MSPQRTVGYGVTCSGPSIGTHARPLADSWSKFEVDAMPSPRVRVADRQFISVRVRSSAAQGKAGTAKIPENLSLSLTLSRDSLIGARVAGVALVVAGALAFGGISFGLATEARAKSSAQIGLLGVFVAGAALCLIASIQIQMMQRLRANARIQSQLKTMLENLAEDKAGIDHHGGRDGKVIRFSNRCTETGSGISSLLIAGGSIEASSTNEVPKSAVLNHLGPIMERSLSSSSTAFNVNNIDKSEALATERSLSEPKSISKHRQEGKSRDPVERLIRTIDCILTMLDQIYEEEFGEAIREMPAPEKAAAAGSLGIWAPRDEEIWFRCLSVRRNFLSRGKIPSSQDGVKNLTEQLDRITADLRCYRARSREVAIKDGS
ncbi:hypothetical protein [Kineosporia babensis]|uniref:Uncharacterized protein n=1 Tax=Kineosporia babensis TaxID=499548 RepID=A0A9X1SYM2_9ACTN|nr:hypothetical protein [Kineosporia babensis]MCD5317261.1 hypothetical protein [Kineosporia babensis]